MTFLGRYVRRSSTSNNRYLEGHGGGTTPGDVVKTLTRGPARREDPLYIWLLIRLVKLILQFETQ